MAELKIENFKYGLDARRDDLVSQPGTLVSFTNGHINTGGELESRGKFTSDANLYPTNTFGLQDTDSGLVTFGSDAAPNASLPTGVTYQRLQDPLAVHFAMTAVVFSCAYRGKAFVIATFISGTYAFYNGNLVPQISDGYVYDTLIPDMASALAVMANRINGWLAHANVIGIAYDGTHNLGYQESNLDGSVLLMSPPGVHFTPTVANNSSTSGLLGVKLIDQNYPGVVAQGAYTAFTLTSVGVNTGDTVTVTAPANANGTGTAQLTNGAITFITDINTTAAAVANAINAFTFITGYSANVAGATVTIYAPASFGAFQNNSGNHHATVVTTGNLNAGAGTPFNALTLKVTQSIENLQSLGNQIYRATKTLNAQVGGVSLGGTVTITWALVNAADQDISPPQGPDGTNPTGDGPYQLLATTGASITAFTAFGPGITSLSHKVRCMAKDNGNGNTQTLFFTVTMTAPD